MTLLKTAILILASHDALRTGFVQARIENEFTAMLRSESRRHNAPTSNHFCKTGDVLLRIASTYTKRMQFEDFAREVFV